jgi:superfamily II DNA helicase RecQ
VIVTYSLKEIDRPVVTKSVELSAKGTTWKELINKDNEVIFISLKNWRLEESKKQGFPPFIIFTNKQLADIAVLKPSTLNHLSQIDGIGPSKMEKYGEKILRLVASSLARIKEDVES